MKKLLPISLCFTILGGTLAEIPVGQQTIKVVWQYDTNNLPDVFKLYSSDNIITPPPLWTLEQTIAGTNLSTTITVFPSKKFYYVTASNIWGETGPSNITNTPSVLTNVNPTISK